MSDYNALITRYEQGVNTLDEALRNVPETVLDREPAPNKWSIRQLAAHLADAELVVCGRIRWIAAQPGTLLKAFDQDLWASALHYQRQATHTSFDLFRTLRASTAAMLRSLPQSAWTQTAVHEERGAMSLEKMVEESAAHVEHHARQIRELRERFKAAA